ncbi:MAG TPA: GtrA family protein [Acidobacteriaceae bacterium]|nr:GtrA family protein [Acidobacteriaceae bacterium]
MSRLVRWLRFNFVGVIGAIVQLGALGVLDRAMHGRYLLATAAALEVTLLHNFIWHVRYTWRDRRPDAFFGALVRFHFSNGLVSMGGNLILMRALVQELRLPVLLANGVAIVSCSAVNFLLGDAWVFAATTKVVPNPGVPG